MHNAMQKRHQGGFSLIELMIVIAIIGILASIAIPQYKIYTNRTNASEALAAIRPIQLAASEYAVTTQAMPPAAADMNVSVGAAAALGIVSSVDYTLDGADGLITATFDAAAGAPADLSGAGANTLVFRGVVNANGVVSWSVDAASTVSQEFWPKM